MEVTIVQHQRQKEYYLLNIELPIIHFREYANFIEKSLKEETVALKEKNTFKNDSLLGRLKQTDIYLYDIQLPTILRSSLLISVDAFLEKTLVSLCIPGESGKKLNLSNKDDKRSVISKAMNHIEEEFKIEIACTKSWGFILDAHKIRNCFVHSGGNVMNSKQKKQLLQIIENREYIKKNRGDYITLNEEFCMEFIDAVENLFVNLSKDKQGNYYRWIPTN